MTLVNILELACNRYSGPENFYDILENLPETSRDLIFRVLFFTEDVKKKSYFLFI